MVYLHYTIYIKDKVHVKLHNTDNFNINNKNVIPRKFFLVFHIQIRRNVRQTVKIDLHFQNFTVSSLEYK